MTSTAEDTLKLVPFSNRSAYRNTLIYASDGRDTVLGGLYATDDMANKNLYSMVRIICVFTGKFYLEDESRELVESNDYDIKSGKYYIFTNGKSTLFFGHRL